MKLKVLLSALVFVLCGRLAAAEKVPGLKPGDAAPKFALQDYRGSAWTLDDVQDKKLVVIAFLGTECPLVKLYAERLQKMSEEFADRGVTIVGINSNQQDSLAEIGHFVKSNNLQFTMLKDAGNSVADQFGAERTPEVFVLDDKRQVRYHGRIDDQFTYGVQRKGADKKFLVDAIADLLAGKPVAVSETELVGCHIGRVLTPRPDSEVTYSNQISRILNKRCVECHRAGEIGPFALTNYIETLGWAEMIAEVVREKRMPPWHADPTIGTFANDCRLSDGERKLIQQWVDAGAPEGNRQELPPQLEFVDGWRIGKPDLVVHMSDKSFSVPATGEVRYQFFAVDPGFKEDKWVKAAECRPGNRAVVHHIIVAAGSRERLAQRFTDGVASEWLAATAPGARPMILPAGSAKRIPAGSKIIFQIHYTPNGKAQDDRSSIGLIFADPKEVKHEVLTQKAANSRFRIPPGDANHQVEADFKFNEDSQMLALFPHMHLRGKSFSYTAHYPDGHTETLLDVPHYDFSWQNSYEFTEPKRMPAGTRIHCVAHFDNSKENWANPDSTATVRWGDQTWEEMMIGYFDMSPVREVSVRTSKADAGNSVSRVSKFVEQTKGKPFEVPAPLLDLAKGATSSTDSWQEFSLALRENVPQLDRVCWISVADGKLTVERAFQSIPSRGIGGEGTVVPAENLLLTEYATTSGVKVHQDILQLTARDFRLFSRLFSSSLHVPMTLRGKPSVISFWSSERDAFPPTAVEILQKVAAGTKE